MAALAPIKVELNIESNVLSERQLARIASLTAARNVLVERGIASAGKADPIDLVNLAMYIESGQDPYALEAIRESPAYPLCTKAKVWGECVLVDGHGAAEYPGQPNTHDTHVDRHGHTWGVSGRTEG
jgi:hypothetical protein